MKTSAELLNETTLLPYLISRKLISSDEIPVVEVLKGGISNLVLAITTSQRDFVLKQSLPELLVPSKWIVSQRRTLVEARAMKVLKRITPKNVPALLDMDPEYFSLVMEHASRDCRVWKDDLLKGQINTRVAHNLGQILGVWHRSTSQKHAILEEFVEDQLFEQLRITPFYREVARIHPTISDRVGQLISELEFSRRTLVHGDFSPKNILVNDSNNVTVVDYEVAHTGHPVFDLAFLLAHLFCKSHHFASAKEKSLLKESANTFMASYIESFPRPVDESLGWHVCAIALARVDGVSQVNYLNEESEEQVRSVSLAFLTQTEPPTISELFS